VHADIFLPRVDVDRSPLLDSQCQIDNGEDDVSIENISMMMYSRAVIAAASTIISCCQLQCVVEGRPTSTTNRWTGGRSLFGLAKDNLITRGGATETETEEAYKEVSPLAEELYFIFTLVDENHHQLDFIISTC